MDGFYPKLSFTSILCLYTCVLNRMQYYLLVLSRSILIIISGGWVGGWLNLEFSIKKKKKKKKSGWTIKTIYNQKTEACYPHASEQINL